MEVDKVADMVAYMEVDKGRQKIIMLIIGRLGFGGVSQMLTRGEGGKPNADHCLKKVIANLICKLTSLSYLGLSNEFQF